jgi:hypothetical protein
MRLSNEPGPNHFTVTEQDEKFQPVRNGKYAFATAKEALAYAKVLMAHGRHCEVAQVIAFTVNEGDKHA